jgi:hypothetical protein
METCLAIGIIPINIQGTRVPGLVTCNPLPIYYYSVPYLHYLGTSRNLTMVLALACISEILIPKRGR